MEKLKDFLMTAACITLIVLAYIWIATCALFYFFVFTVIALLECLIGPIVLTLIGLVAAKFFNLI